VRNFQPPPAARRLRPEPPSQEDQASAADGADSGRRFMRASTAWGSRSS
jgi:hypothetical protein